MKSYSTAYANEISAPCRSLRAEFISAHEHSYSSDYISSITIEAPQIDGKFFGYSISHKAKVVLLRNASRTPFTKGDWFIVTLGTASQLMEFPKFYIDSIQEDSKTGKITLEGYDNVYSMNNYTFKDLNYGSTFTKTISQIINDIGTLLGVTITNNGLNLTKEYTQTTLNVAGDTPIRSLITNIAEVTGTILVNSGASGDNLKFIKLGSTSSLSITKSHYFESEAGTTTTLTSLASVNALGDTVQVGTTGYTQVIQDNAFLTNLDDSEISTILTTILNGVVKTVCSYTLDWIGNPALEYGDLITIDSKDSTITTNYLSINLQYNGGLKESISWQPNSETTATAAANTNINSAISKTEAKVDKANKEITLTVAEINEAKGEYTTLKQKLDSIELEAGTGNVTFKQDTVPTGTSTRALLAGDLWFNTGASGYTNNKWYRYNGSTWDVLTDGELATATSNITNLTITTNGLSTSVQSLNTEVDGLNSRMETAESTIEQQAGQIALKASQASVTELTTVVNGKASQSNLDDLSNEVDTKATKTELNNLSSTVDGKASQAALNLLSEQVAEKADSATVNALTTRVTSAEANIDGLEGEIVLKATKQEVTELSTVVDGKASQTDLNSLSTVVDSKASQAALNALSDILDDKADTTTVTALTSRVSQAEADIDAAEAAITLKADNTTVSQLTTVVDGKASQTDLNNLSTAVEGKAAQSDLEALGKEVKSKADSSTVTALTTRVTSAEADIDGLDAQIVLKADSSTVTQLETVVKGKADSSTVTEIESRVTSAELDIDGLEGKIDLKVAKDGVISAINLSSEEATISANKINLNGYVTLTDLSTSGSTTINGDNITTGTINADLIKTGTLDASNVTITNLNANNITSGTINASDITITNINADNITSGTIDASNVTITNLNADNITSGTIDASNVTITNLNADNITSGTIDTARINTTEIFNKDSLELKVEDKGYTGTITVSIPAYAVYGFPESSDGWHESNNYGVNNSYALSQASFTTAVPNTKIVFEVYNDAEASFDFLEIGLLDKTLSRSSAEDSYSDLLNSYKGLKYTKDSPDIVQIDIPTAGAHFIEFKFIKDASTHTAPDKAGFRLITNYPSSFISLSYGGIDIGTSQSLHINGMVTFSDLESKGSTSINGSNITTGELSADRINGGTIKASEIYLGDISTQGVQITENGELSTNGGIIRADLITINNSGTTMSSTEVQSNNIIANNNIIAHTSIDTPKLVLDDYNGHYSSAYPFASTSTSTTYYIWLVPDSVPFPTPSQPTNWSFSLQCTTNGESYNQNERVALPRDETFNVSAVFTNVTNPSLHLYKSWSSSISSGQTSSASHAENNIDAGYYFDPSISTKVFPRTITSGITQYGFCIEDNLLPYDNNSWNIGSTNLKWDTIYARVGTIQTSDRNEKKDIEVINDKYSQLFDKLNPVTYKFNDGHRTHVGLIAQEVEQALTEVGIDSEDFAGFVKDTKTDGSDSYGLRYDEFIGILIKEVQNLKHEVERLKNGTMG